MAPRVRFTRIRRAAKSNAVACGVSAAILAVSGCATTTYAHRAGDDRVGGAFQQPFKDVSWMREDPPEVLKHAVTSPYALETTRECSAILNEISALDLVLGPDLDTPAQKKKATFGLDPVGLLTGAIGGVVGLPYRGIVRKVSGAEQREKVLADAIFAGMARRAFLKGAARASDCLAPTPPTSEPQAAPQADNH